MRPRLACFAVLVGVLAGCGSSSTSNGSATSTLPGATPPPGAVVDTPSSPLIPPNGIPASPKPLAAVASSDGDHELQSVPWTLAAKRNGGRTLVISYNAGGCNSDGGGRITETSTYVVIATYNVVPKPTAQQMPCPAIAEVIYAAADLKAPLGSRPLYHAPVSTTSG